MIVYPRPLALAAAGLGAVSACPEGADAWQSQQNGYCADEFGWPLRPDGSVMTRQDIESAARGEAVKQYWPYAVGGLLLILLLRK